ncbi:Cysteine synthase A [Serratia rubidaea]|uniref:Cysteine synthase A n=1 Tax=Serratia rubidaea TaxID=61652 RepID=A0A447QGI0_SERRU|nr:Cysteine synthase A [Serratia rubidaea]
MSKIYEDNSLTIGHTPLVRLNRIGNGRILAKVESATRALASNAASAPI